MTEQAEQEVKEPKDRLVTARASINLFPSLQRTMDQNPWYANVDTLTSLDHKKYRKVIKNCRFFFRHDPLASTVISKMVDMAINDMVIGTDHLSRVSQTEEAIFQSVSDDIVVFLRKAAFEYLLTGLVVPEIRLTRLKEKELRRREIPRASSMLYPTEMWLRDSYDIEIKRPPIGSEESYFVRLPDDVLSFIRNRGKYGDGTEDKELFKKLATLYPRFVAQIIKGEDAVRLENPLVIKSTALADDQYPIPYLYPALEPLRHKRNLRRMDYSIAARVISAILHAKIGSDEFPLTEDQSDQMDDLESKFKWRQNLTAQDIERVFLLITNHTVSLEWVFPDVKALLDNAKYETVNQDIMVALGFPRILITGETERSFASDPQIATISPLQTMERIRKALLPIAKFIFFELMEKNDIVNNVPEVKFKPINLMSMQLFYEGLSKLYETGNLSRESFTEAYGYDFNTQLKNRKVEDEKFEEMDLLPFQEVPHSNEPGRPSGGKPPEAPPE
jgi:hypothetical protein